MVHFHRSHKSVNKAGVIDEGPAHGRVNVIPEHHQIINRRSGANQSMFRLGSLNVGTLRGRAGEVVETLT